MTTAGKLNETSTLMTRRKFLRTTLWAAVIVGGPVNALAIEPYRLQVTRHDVPLRKLPQELDGFTIAQLSDLHRSLIVPDDLIAKAVEMTNDLKPDIVVATGDFVNRRASNAGPCAEMLSKLTPRLGKYAVLGNHDHWTNPKIVTKHFEANGIPVLDNSSVRLHKGLTLIGIDDFWVGKPDFDKAWSKADPDDAHVFLCHNPLAVRRVKKRECFMISGHTHGGQVNLPLIPRRVLPGLKGWHYIQGWFTVGKVQLYVNRGIGMINPPIRFMCRPEISLFRLRADG